MIAGTGEAADEGECCDQDAMPQRHADGKAGERQGGDARHRPRDHGVERDRREQRAVERRHACRGHRLRHAIVARPHLLGAGDQPEAEQRGQDHPHFGRQLTLLDRVADQEDRRERQRDRADPDEGACAQPLLPADIRRLRAAAAGRWCRSAQVAPLAAGSGSKGGGRAASSTTGGGNAAGAAAGGAASSPPDWPAGAGWRSRPPAAHSRRAGPMCGPAQSARRSACRSPRRCPAR